jgi:two-component system sensor histidine kinase KdpD
MPLEELVDEALGSLGAMVPAGRVRVDAPSDLPLLVIDHVIMSQVLANILDNAVRLSPANSSIVVSARRAASSSSRVEVAVSDQGPGIAPAERERVFEMFSQNGGGGRAGLGLAIAKAFVEAHDGRIWVDPATRRGARVVFTVPSEALVPAHA